LRYKVPQNIDMQDRIVGPLTMVQFVYAVIGGGLCYSIFMTIPRPYSYLLILPVAAFTVAIVFIKVNERPFINFFLAMIDFFSRPKKRVWRHGSTDNLRVVIYRQRSEPKYQHKEVSPEKIKELAQKLDMGEKTGRQ
jgi:hypothetical protein